MTAELFESVGALFIIAVTTIATLVLALLCPLKGKEGIIVKSIILFTFVLCVILLVAASVETYEIMVR